MGIHGLRTDCVFLIRFAPSRMFLLLAITTVAGPGHSLQACPGDRLVTDFTNAKRTLSDPIERGFDRCEETTVGLMQADLQLRFGIGGGLVSRIPIPASRSWNRTLTIVFLDGQFAPFGKQHLSVSVQFSSIHFQSCRIPTGRFRS